MPLFDNLEKLITEHGSAQILRERLLLAEDKYLALERRLKALVAENEQLKEENRELVSQIPVSTARLGSEQAKVLSAFASVNGFVSRNDIQRLTGLTMLHIDYCIGVLSELGYVVSSGFDLADTELTYAIDQKGRKYAIEHGLVR